LAVVPSPANLSIESIPMLQRAAGNVAVTGLIQRSLLDDAAAVGSGLLETAGGIAHGAASTVEGLVSGGPTTAAFLPGGSGDWHELAQALTIGVGALDLAVIAGPLAQKAITEAGNVTLAGGDYGPQNALRHCIFAGLLDSHGWRLALEEVGIGVLVPGIFSLMGELAATMALRVRLVLEAHEWFGDESCGNFGTGTVDSECDQHNNSVGIGLGGPFTSDADVIRGAKDALDRGDLKMTPGPTDLSRTIPTAGWAASPWLDGGPQQPDCSKVVKK
jgi:hypothetical protein